MKKILNKFLILFYFFLTYFFSFPILAFIFIVRPFFILKIGELETRAIGHSSISIEIFLCEIEKKIHDKKRKEIYIWFRNRDIANRFLYQKWKEKLIIIPGIFLEGAYNLSRYLKFNKFYCFPYRHWKDDVFNWGIIDIHNVLKETEPKIVFNKKEKELGELFLNSLNINYKDNFVSFFNRDKSFRKEKNKTVRNSSIFKMIPAINELTKKNYKAIRLGAKTNEILKSDKTIFDYSNSGLRSEFLDIYIIYRSKFVISDDTGLNMVPAMFRKKQLILNYINFASTLKENHNFIKFILPKKIFDIRKNSLISLDKILKDKLYNIEFSDEFEKKGYQVIDNSEEEILASVIEMYEYIEFGKINSKFENKNRIYNKLINNHFSIDRVIPKISSVFFEKFDDFV